MFSFNTPHGACDKCSGLGFLMRFDPNKVVHDPDKSLYDGALGVWGKSGSYWYIDQIRSLEKNFNFDAATSWKNLPQKIRDLILYGSGKQKIDFSMVKPNAEFHFTRSFEGVIPNLERRYLETKSEDMRIWMEGYMTNQLCDECGGRRLKKEVLAVKVGGRSIADVTEMSIKNAVSFFSSIKLNAVEEQISHQILKEIRTRLHFLNDVGIEYLTLDRAAGTLSGGESQRIRLATQIGSSLTGVLYVLDEPSIGLHQRDNARLLKTLRHLTDIGNTLIVVEHDSDTMYASDYIVDIGPLAGVHGGEIVFAGDVSDIVNCAESITGQYLSGKKRVETPKKRRKSNGNKLRISGAAENNLREINVDIPLGVFTCVTGVSGSGKSSLINEIVYKRLARDLNRARVKPGKHKDITGLENLDKVINIDQSPIGRTPRSNPATYTGLFDLVRDVFAQTPEAKVRGYLKGRFSFNVKGGRCEACAGDGILKIEMHFLPDVYVPCEVCGGKRYNRETLEVKYKGKSISDVLDMTVEDALQFFENLPRLKDKLQTLFDVGLTYVKLGQSSTTLSGGEAQRVKLATELSRRATGKTMYVLDEPTTGLHAADVHKLIGILGQLTDWGNTVVVIEHNLDVIKTADYIIDLGPEGGGAGGQVVVSGTPEAVAKNKNSFTGKFLKEVL